MLAMAIVHVRRLKKKQKKTEGDIENFLNKQAVSESQYSLPIRKK